MNRGENDLTCIYNRYKNGTEICTLVTETGMTGKRGGGRIGNAGGEGRKDERDREGGGECVGRAVLYHDYMTLGVGRGSGGWFVWEKEGGKVQEGMKKGRKGAKERDLKVERSRKRWRRRGRRKR